MKTSLFWFLLLCSVVAFSFPAQAQESQSTMALADNPNPKTTVIAQSFAQNSIANSNDGVMRLAVNRDFGLANLAAIDKTYRTCAFIRTYRVLRPYKNSDFVEHDGYSTCIPMKNLGLKSAVETEDEPETSK